MGQVGTKEAAERLGLTQQHISALIRSGELRASRIGRTWVIDERSLKAFEAKQRPGPGRPRKDSQQ